MSRHQMVSATLTLLLAGVISAVADSAAALPQVAVMASSPATWTDDVRAKLSATGRFALVDVFDIRVVTPTLAQMQQYSGLLVYTANPLNGPTMFGDRLAAYVDGGGGVVTALSDSISAPIQGRFADDNYWAIEPCTFVAGVEPQGLGAILDASHPILIGVTTFNGGALSFRPDVDCLHPDATRIADWTGPGTVPLIATRLIGSVRRADLSFYPPSDDAGSGLWDSTTDGALIMANALSWVGAVCGDEEVQIGETCDDGNLIDGDGCDANCTITACGNGRVTTGELCDDGNLTDGDCCSSVCSPAPDGTSCDDERFCNGTDECVGGACSVHTGDPCASGGECNDVCNEARDTCFARAGAACTDEGNECTEDVCDGAGTCTHHGAFLTPCDDGLFCNGADFCLGGTCSYHDGDPCVSIACIDRCDEVSASCVASTSGTECFEDGNECTADECDGAGACVHPPIPGCETRTPTATRTRTRTRTPTRTPTVTPTPQDTPTGTPVPVPAALVVNRVRLKPDSIARPGRSNGSATVRGVLNANAPFGGLEDEVTLTGVALRIAGAGGVEMTLVWPASSCSVLATGQGSRIKCDFTDGAGRRKLQLRPTSKPNLYSVRFSGRQLSLPGPLSGVPVRIVLITQAYTRPDDIYACELQGTDVVCGESGIVATPTPAPPLGERRFSVARPGSAIMTSALPDFDVATETWSASVLRLYAEAPAVDGIAPLRLLSDVIIGAKLIDGSTFCIKIFAAGSHGSIDCDGGSSYDVLDSWESNGAGPNGFYLQDSGFGPDAGPGAATLFAPWNAFNLPTGTTVASCLSQFYFSDTMYGFTTATATGIFTNAAQGGTVTVAGTGENFDCATWTQENGPGQLVRPMLAADTIIGDAANLLILADVSSNPPPPAPTLTPTARP